MRWTFDTLYLWDGVPLVPVVLGLFALPELAELAVTRQRIAGEHAADITLQVNGRGFATWFGIGGWSSVQHSRHRARGNPRRRLGGHRLDRLRLCAAHRAQFRELRLGRCSRRHRPGKLQQRQGGRPPDPDHCVRRSSGRVDGGVARRFPDARPAARAGDADQASRPHLYDRMEPDAGPRDRRLDPACPAAGGLRSSRKSVRRFFFQSCCRLSSSRRSRVRTIGELYTLFLGSSVGS